MITFLDAIKLGTEIIGGFGSGIKFIRKELLGIGEGKADSEIEKINEQLTKTARSINSIIDKQGKLGDGFLDKILGNGSGQAEKLQKDLEVLRIKRQQLLKERAEAIKKQDALEEEQNKKQKTIVQEKISDQQLLQQAAITNDRLIVESFAQREELLSELFNRGLLTRAEAETAQRQLAIEEEQQLQDFRDGIAERQIENEKNITGAVLLAAKRQKLSYVDLGKTLNDLAIRGFGNAFRNIGRALASGENANNAFVDAVKATAGEAASALGDFYIKRGIAYLADPLTASQGPPVIAAGAGLKVLAGALSASSSGGSSGGGGGGSFAPSGGIGDPINTQPVQDEPIERAEAQGAVTINIDRFVGEEEEAQRVAELLSDAGAKDGVLLTNVRGFA